MVWVEYLFLGEIMENLSQAESAIITVTDTARDQFFDFAAQNNKSFIAVDKSIETVYLRIKVMAGGCAGFQYAMQLEPISQEFNPLTDTILVNNMIPIITDHKSKELINGLVIDYKNDLMEGGFKFLNPNANSSCGCGKSFQ